MTEYLFNFLGLSVSQFEAALHFYRDLLGVATETVPEWDEWAGLGETWDLVRESQGRALICELFGGAPPPPDRDWGRGQSIRPGIHVPDADATRTELRGRGVAFTGSDEVTWARCVEFEAPEHVKWALVASSDYPSSADLQRPRLGSVEVKVSDLEAHTRFYQDEFGFVGRRRSPSEIVLEQGPGEATVVLRPGGQTVIIDETDWDHALLTQPVWMCIMTPDIEEAKRQLTGSGVTVYRDITTHSDWKGTDLVIGDPDGNPIQVLLGSSES